MNKKDTNDMTGTRKVKSDGIVETDTEANSEAAREEKHNTNKKRKKQEQRGVDATSLQTLCWRFQADGKRETIQTPANQKLAAQKEIKNK